MDTAPPPTLWIELQQGRYFLVPEGKRLPAGETLLISASGSVCHADLAGVVAWEVPEPAATAYLQINTMQYFLNLREITSGWQAWHESLNISPQTEAGLTGDALLASLFLGFTAEESRQDPTTPLRSLRRLALQMADFIEDSISGSEERLEQARQNLQILTAHLRAQSIDIKDGLDELPNQLRLWYTATSDPDKFAQLIASLRTFGDQTQPASGDHIAGQQAFVNLARGLAALFDDPEKRHRERYQALARKAVDSAVGEVPQFDFKKVWAKYKQQHGEVDPASRPANDSTETSQQ